MDERERLSRVEKEYFKRCLQVSGKWQGMIRERETLKGAGVPASKAWAVCYDRWLAGYGFDGSWDHGFQAGVYQPVGVEEVGSIEDYESSLGSGKKAKGVEEPGEEGAPVVGSGGDVECVAEHGAGSALSSGRAPQRDGWDFIEAFEYVIENIIVREGEEEKPPSRMAAGLLWSARRDAKWFARLWELFITKVLSKGDAGAQRLLDDGRKLQDHMDALLDLKLEAEG